MALIKCPECGKEISDLATDCPNCGCPIKRSEGQISENSNRGAAGKVFLILGIICGIGWVVFSLATAGDMVGEKAFYLTHGFYSSEYIVNTIITNVLLIGAILMSVIGTVICLVYRRRK